MIRVLAFVKALIGQISQICFALESSKHVGSMVVYGSASEHNDHQVGVPWS